MSQVLTERLLLFHSSSPAPFLPPPPGPASSLATSPGGSVQASRYSGQEGRNGMVAYLVDCYERIMFEERYIKVLVDDTLSSISER